MTGNVKEAGFAAFDSDCKFMIIA
jgi:hypothetical protein